MDSHPGVISRLLVDEGLLDADQLRYAERVRSKLATPRPMPEVISDLFGIEAERVREVIRKRRTELRLGDLLVELGHLGAEELENALGLQREDPSDKRKLGRILIEHHFIDEAVLADVLSLHLGVPFEDTDPRSIQMEELPRFPIKWCEEYGIVPLRAEPDGVVVAFSDPTSRRALQGAEEIYGKGRVIPVIARPSAIQEILKRLASDEAGAPVAKEGLSESAVVTTVDEILGAAIERAASDIHIEPRRDRLVVRFREDGVLINYREYPLSMATPLSSRVKVLCEADITERRRHQGGRFFFEHDSPTGRQRIDMRVSMYVTVHGEKIVLRLLNHDRRLVSLERLGMGPRMVERFREDALERPSGVVLVTGPTGSGKTTTLYSCIDEIRDDETSIITAEDPVEYVIDGIAQCSINPAINLSYDETLKHIVRQDPDVIVIGEIRDTFSAEVAIQAALTGHKVLTTFHTEDTIGGLLRLLNMNIEAFLVSSTVVSVLAQRLLRKVCEGCARPYQPTPADLRRLGYAKDALVGGNFRVGAGCDACRRTGYKGRVAVFELLVLDAAVRDAILTRQTSYEIRRISRESSGLVSLLEDGITKAAAGQTTISEIVRMLPRLDKPRPLSELRRLVGQIQS